MSRVGKVIIDACSLSDCPWHYYSWKVESVMCGFPNGSTKEVECCHYSGKECMHCILLSDVLKRERKGRL